MTAPLHDIASNGYVRVYRDHARKWRWARIHANGRSTGVSGQGYRSRWYTIRQARRFYPGVEIRIERP
jgi:uncharacterized protein YegP (UPF0339 family)